MQMPCSARTVLVLLVAGVLGAVLAPVASTVAHAQPSSDFAPVTDEMLQDPPASEWLMWRRTLDGWGYSPLDQIDRGNVGDLRMSGRAHSPRDASRARRSSMTA